MVFALVLLFAGVQGVFASMACEGTVYFKLPDGWRSAYAVAGGRGQDAPFTKSEYDGWLQVSTSKIGGTNSATGFFIEETGANDCNSGHCVRPDSMNVKYLQLSDASGFKCVNFGADGELWIQAHPDPSKENVTYYSKTPPDVKYFYVFLPQVAEWKSAVPMIVEDSKAPVAMNADPQRCGWYYRRYIDEVPPSQVVIYRDDDEQKKEGIGMDGDWGVEGVVSPIPLNTMFDYLKSDEIYFMATEEYADNSDPDAVGWTTTDNNKVGICGYDLAAKIYDTDASLHGAFTCNPDWFDGQTDAQARANACYYSSAKFNVVNSNSAKVPCIGVTTGMVTDILNADTKKPTLTNVGKTCFGSDAEKAFEAMFNPTENVNEAYCFNLPFTQTDDGKYEFDSDNYEGPEDDPYPAPGGFYPAESTPPANMFLEGSTPLPAAESKRKAEGPVFVCADYNNQRNPGEGLRAINSQEGVPEIDLFCKGPGWSGGIDCEGLFAGGSEFNAPGFRAPAGVSFTGDGWGWSCQNEAPIGWTFYDNTNTERAVGKVTAKNQMPTGTYRWTSGANDYDALRTGGRNQHFCFESHASFRYKKGLRFSFRGDDDIWVYIDNKLAVDLGGTHLAAPGYVDLDKFVGAQGKFEVGTEYDIDIFFCDRRTTMSNVRIKTNMFIKQTQGLSKKIISKKNGVELYGLCYAVSSNGTCGGGTGKVDCNPDADFELQNEKKQIILSTDAFRANPVQYNGGIDVTTRSTPQLDKKILNESSGLPPGKYTLWAIVGTSREKFEFTIEGDVNVVNKHGVAQDEDGNVVAEYDITSLALASSEGNPTRVPIYISNISDRGDDALLFTSAAVGQPYGITVTNSDGQPTADVYLEVKDADGNFKTWNGTTQRQIGKFGVDTIYASIKMSFMQKEQETYNFSVTGHAVSTSVTFFAPRLVYVPSENASIKDTISGDDPTEEKFVGPVYFFYILALAPSITNPGTFEECGDRCNFILNMGTETSQGISTTEDTLRMVNGRATVSIYSTKEYRIADGDVPDNPAKLVITGPAISLMKAKYSPLHFKKPPVPYPVFADIFDARGIKAPTQLNMDEPYFSSSKEYLDGIADSLVIYYNRPFYNNPDSLPNKIVVFWDDGEDSVVIEKDVFRANMRCGAAAEPKLDDTLCMQRVVIGGVNFSKDVKTTSPGANLKSYARYSDRGRVKEDAFPGVIVDRVPPFIKAADVRKRDDKTDILTLTMSEYVVLKDPTLEQKAFTFYLNSAANLKTADQKYVEGVKSVMGATIGADKVSLLYSGSDDNPTPHTGDYVRFRADNVIWSDSATISVLGDSLRSKDDAKYAWNSPTPYNSEDRLPSVWTQVTGEAEVGVKAIKYTEIPPDIMKGVKKGDIEVTSVKSYPVTMSFDEVKAKNPGRLGYFLKSDMNSLVYSDTNIANYFTDPKHSEDVKNIVLEIELDLFTNLGNFVAHDVQRIHCTDTTYYGSGHTCLDTQKNFFISWNLVSVDKRLVGTGAYISKMNSAVSLPKFGKKNKMDETQMWGVRRTKKANKMSAELVEQ